MTRKITKEELEGLCASARILENKAQNDMLDAEFLYAKLFCPVKEGDIVKRTDHCGRNHFFKIRFVSAHFSSDIGLRWSIEGTTCRKDGSNITRRQQIGISEKYWKPEMLVSTSQRKVIEGGR